MIQQWILVGFVIGLGFGCPAAENMIINAGLEVEQKGSFPEGWRYSVSGAAEAVYIRDGSPGRDVYTGTHALSIRAGMSPSDQWFVANEQLPKVEPGRSYHLSANVKAEHFKDSSALRLSVVYLNADRSGKGLPQAPAVILSGSKDWRAVSLDFTVPAGVQFVRPTFSMFCSGSTSDLSARAFLDDVELTVSPETDARRGPRQRVLDWNNLKVYAPASGRTEMPHWRNFSGWTASSGDVKVKSAGQALHVSGKLSGKEPLRISPPRPIKLSSETERIHTWLARQSGDFKVRYVIQDSLGEEHLVDGLNSYPYIGDTYANSSGREQDALWSVWEQHYSMNFQQPEDDELRRRVVPEKLDEARSYLWKKPLTLSAIEICPVGVSAGQSIEFHMAAPSVLILPERQTRYAWFNASRRRVGWDEPAVVFPDDFRDVSGTFHYQLEICQGEQGRTVWVKEGEWEQCSRQDPLRLMGDAIVLPELPVGFYSILLKNRGGDGLRGESRMAFHVMQSPVESLLSAEPGFAIESGQPNHVFPAGSEAAELTVVLNDFVLGGSADRRVKLRVEDWRGNEVFNREFPAAKEIPVCFPVKEADYYAVATLLDDGRVLDRARLHLGVASGPNEEGPFVPPAKPATDGELQLTAEYSRPQLSERFYEHPSTPWTSPHELFRFDRWLKEQVAGRGIDEVSSLMPWADIEVLPGVFRWEESDRRNVVAITNGVRVKAFLGVLGKWPPWTPDWWAGELCLSQFGRPDRVGENAVSSRNPWPSNYDDQGRYIFLPWIASSVKHVRDNPMVSSYKLMFPSPGWIGLPEGKAECTATDYSPAAEKVFCDWLKRNGKESRPLPGHLIIPQAPMAELGPDLSEEWQDMCRFVQESSTNRLAEILQTLRALDPQRPVTIYRGKFPVFEAALPMMKRDNACFFDESGPNFFSRAFASMSAQAGVRYANENHFYMPSSREVIDADIFYGSIYNQGWSYSYRWHERHKNEDARFYDALDFVARSRSMIEQYAAAQSPAPQVLVFGSRLDQMLNNDQSAFFGAVSGLDFFTGLFSYFQVLPHFADEFTEWIQLDNFKVVFVCGDVMSRAAIERVCEYAQRGGHVILVGDAGRYCPETPAKRDCLAMALRGVANVRRLPALSTPPPAPGAAPEAPFSADPVAMQNLLDWAGIERDISVVLPGGALDARFEGLVRRIDADSCYVAVFRRAAVDEGGPYNAWYNALMLADRNRERWGVQEAYVRLQVPMAGQYRIARIHRNAGATETRDALNGRLEFETSPLSLGELQVYRVEKIK